MNRFRTERFQELEQVLLHTEAYNRDETFSYAGVEDDFGEVTFEANEDITEANTKKSLILKADKWVTEVKKEMEQVDTWEVEEDDGSPERFWFKVIFKKFS
jgi:hypothetical protein